MGDAETQHHSIPLTSKGVLAARVKPSFAGQGFEKDLRKRQDRNIFKLAVLTSRKLLNAGVEHMDIRHKGTG